ncbi:methyltransferase [Hamadaea tsunoensis]|uniref:methyltransferase n=1 Tax=Hamadaea tsunoensis TaxID=53368 RepID=UPI0003FD5D4D|nr:methyltransferase [Hamadaea tsunoensis]
MTAPDPQRILQYANGFMAAQYVMVAAETGVFAQLGGTGPQGLGLEEIAGRCGLPTRTTRLLIDALAQLGLVERDGDRYRNAPDAEAFLTGRGPADVRPLLHYFHAVSFPGWVDALRAFRTGEGVRAPLTAAQTQAYEEGIATVTAPAARELAATVDFGQSRRVLDVGGGAGMFLTAILDRHPHLTGTLLDLPAMADLVRPRLAAGPLAGRVEVVGRDMLGDPIPAGHDVVVLANVLHLLPPDRNRTLLARLRPAVEPGARLLLVDWWLDPVAPHRRTVMVAGEFLTVGGGDVYRVDEAADWLAETGWRADGLTPLSGPMGLVTAYAQ